MAIRIKRLHRSPLAAALVTTAIAIAGCGGSSSSPSSPTGTSASVPQALPPSTEVSSPVYRAFVKRGLTRIPGVPPQAIPGITACVIQKQLSQGIKTVGDVNANRTEVSADGVACAHAAGLK